MPVLGSIYKMPVPREELALSSVGSQRPDEEMASSATLSEILASSLLNIHSLTSYGK